MARTNASKAGRNSIPIDWDLVGKLFSIWCTQIEVCGVIGCSVHTLERAARRELKRPLTEFFEEKRNAGKASLRRKQWELAMSGNVSMLIWLGKNILDQKEKVDIEGHLIEPMALTLPLARKRIVIAPKAGMADAVAAAKELPSGG